MVLHLLLLDKVIPALSHASGNCFIYMYVGKVSALHSPPNHAIVLTRHVSTCLLEALWLVSVVDVIGTAAACDYL
jgi:hypothetical protein